MLPKRQWQEMTTEDFRDAGVTAWIAVLPVAAIEQHGPHLPLATDRIIAEGYLARVAELLPDHIPATFLPLAAIGKSDEHISSPGTLTHGWDTLARSWIEIGDAVARSGVRKLVIINSHGGNVPIVDIVTRELRLKHDMLAVGTNWSRFGYPDGLYDARERRYGIHGGDIETSLMLALRTDLVRCDKMSHFRSQQESFEQEFKHLRGYGPVQFGWKTQDLNPAGAIGDATLATAAKGEASLDHGARAFVELLDDVHRFDLARLWQPAAGAD
ncbi:MAG: creatininase family protein [Ancalomicrobiaceae bacterium]|nr:creatininase family protein [Ancalomicrobiaceae bacterium]